MSTWKTTCTLTLVRPVGPRVKPRESPTSKSVPWNHAKDLWILISWRVIYYHDVLGVWSMASLYINWEGPAGEPFYSWFSWLVDKNWISRKLETVFLLFNYPFILEQLPLYLRKVISKLINYTFLPILDLPGFFSIIFLAT